MMRKDHFKQKLILWPQVSFNEFSFRSDDLFFICLLLSEQPIFVKLIFVFCFLFTQSFVWFSSVFTKLWNYRILNSAWVTSYPRMKKNHFAPGFLCIFLLTLWRKKLQQSFLVFLIFFPGVMKLQSFECSNCISM